MAVVPIISQSWDTSSYVNPTRMNNIETNIGIVSNATGVKYAEGVSVKDKIDDIAQGEMKTLARGSWSWNTQASYSIEVNSNNTVIVFGARNDRGFMAICPNNNNEIYVISNNIGCTITNAFENGHHTITFSNRTTYTGSNVFVNVIG